VIGDDKLAETVFVQVVGFNEASMESAVDEIARLQVIPSVPVGFYSPHDSHLLRCRKSLSTLRRHLTRSLRWSKVSQLAMSDTS